MIVGGDDVIERSARSLLTSAYLHADRDSQTSFFWRCYFAAFEHRALWRQHFPTSCLWERNWVDGEARSTSSESRWRARCRLPTVAMINCQTSDDDVESGDDVIVAHLPPHNGSLSDMSLRASVLGCFRRSGVLCWSCSSRSRKLGAVTLTSLLPDDVTADVITVWEGMIGKTDDVIDAVEVCCSVDS